MRAVVIVLIMLARLRLRLRFGRWEDGGVGAAKQGAGGLGGPQVAKEKGEEWKRKRHLPCPPTWAVLLDTKGPEIRTAMLK